MKVVLYVHGKGGTAPEAEHYKALFPDCDVIGFDYTAQTPWDCTAEFRSKADELLARYDGIILVANSIGAFFSMNAFSASQTERAFFISPIVDMERLICDMMKWAGVTEDELRERGEIPTDFGEVLSWEYLCYVREHPIIWDVPTDILYGDTDNLTSYDTVSAFAAAHGARLTVMRGGEHWFHTTEQMAYLDKWIKEGYNVSSDMTVRCDDGFINVRVGAIIMKAGKVLMAGSTKNDYLYSVGGRLRFGETAEEAVVREVFEETGARMEVDRLGFVHENYFYGDMDYNRGKLIYEISFYFYMIVPDDFEPTRYDFAEGDIRAFLRWISPDEPSKYYPEFFRTELLSPCAGVKHFVTDERR